MGQCKQFNKNPFNIISLGLRMRESEQEQSHDSNKPVSINISFNINPKNILNNVMPMDNKLKGRKIGNQEILQPQQRFLPIQPLKTPELAQTDRNIYNKDYDMGKANDESKNKRSRKRNSIDHNFNKDSSFKYSDLDKSTKFMKKNQFSSGHTRKKSTKSKGIEIQKSKRSTSKQIDEQIKLGSRTVGVENHIIKSTNIDYNSASKKIFHHKQLKSLFNKIINNDLSQNSFPSSSMSKGKVVQQSRKKPKKKTGKLNKSQTLLHQERLKDFQELNRKKLIEKLTSLKSMNNSLFQTEMEEEETQTKKQKSIIIHTQQSMPCIDEIHQIQLKSKFLQLDQAQLTSMSQSKVHETQNLISTYIAILEQKIQYEGQLQPFEQTYNRRQQQELIQESQENRKEQNSAIKPFSSSEMTKQQNLINQLQRIQLNELKKHQIQKWSELLTFIKESLKNRTTNTEQILSNVYAFLQKTKEDLQHEVQTNQKSMKKENIDQFTNKLSPKDEKPDVKIEEPEMDEIQSMSFKENQAEEDEELKLMNLQTIQNALKQRYESLLERQQKEIFILEQQRDLGKISEIDFIFEKQKIQKWIKNQTSEIMKAKKNIWKGYNEAKGILQKTAKSRYFEDNENSGKKKSMMKCLSENYLLKTNYKKVLLSKQDFQSLSSSLKSSEESIEAKQNKESNEEEEMEKLKERLLDIKHKHLHEESKDNEEDEANISYEQIQKDLEESYSSQQIKLIKRDFEKDHLKAPSLPINQEKLKYICAEDKQDIFQFIFLDLCIELYQEPCHENAIMDSIGRHISKIKAQANKKRGVRTNLNVVKEYLKRFIGYIFRTNKDILKTIDDPLGPTALEMLRYMHDNEEENHDEEETVTTLVIPIVVFDQFERTLLPSIEFERYYDEDEKENKRVQFLKNILHIHNKAIFDALNEYLDQLRPFGIWGKPFPWKKSSTFFHLTDETSKQTKLKKASDKVIEYCSYVCGLLIDKEQSLVGNAKLSEEYIEQIKEDRLSRMLANQLVQNEQRWLFYDDEETEVMVEIGNYIYGMLLREAGLEILKLI